MAITPVYLIAAKNLEGFLAAVRDAQAPEKVALKFVEDLGFKSTNDRLFIPLLKALRFIDEGGKPTARYHEFLDDSEWKRVLAAGIRDAFPELFRVNKNAHLFSREQLTGKLKSLGEGKLSDPILQNTIKTFLALVKLADFETPSESASSATPEAVLPAAATPASTEPTPTPRGEAEPVSAGLVYRIEIVLPATRDQAIYDAIFRSAKQHLLK